MIQWVEHQCLRRLVDLCVVVKEEGVELKQSALVACQDAG